MAIINCPACNKTISDKAESCSHCGYEFNGQSAEDIQRDITRRKNKRLHSLQNQSMLAILVFLAGCYFVFMGNLPAGENGILMYNAAVLAAAVGFVWYAVNRVRIMLVKRSSF